MRHSNRFNREFLDFIKASKKRYKLFIFDVNGVLDNLYRTKKSIVKKIVPSSDVLVKKIIVAIERLYEADKSSSLDKIIRSAFFSNGIKLSTHQIVLLEKGYLESNLIRKDFLNALISLEKERKVCLYTSLTLGRLKRLMVFSTKGFETLQFFTRERFIEEKPSINNLLEICSLSGVHPTEAIIFGDNVAVDLMPAKLIGMRTVLVTNYVDDLISDVRNL